MRPSAFGTTLFASCAEVEMTGEVSGTNPETVSKPRTALIELANAEGTRGVCSAR